MDSIKAAGDEKVVRFLPVANRVKKIGERPKSDVSNNELSEIKIDEDYITNLLGNGMLMNHNDLVTFNIDAQDHFEYYKVDNF